VDELSAGGQEEQQLGAGRHFGPVGGEKERADRLWNRPAAGLRTGDHLEATVPQELGHHRRERRLPTPLRTLESDEDASGAMGGEW
jgi:hypothetical protein